MTDEPVGPCAKERPTPTATDTGSAARLRLWLKSLAAETVKAFHAHAVLIAIVLLYAGAILITGRALGSRATVVLSLYSGMLIKLMGIFTLFFLPLHALRIVLAVRPERPLQYFVADLRTNYLTAPRLLNALVLLLVLPTFMSTFTCFKTMIPIIHPFSWDASLARWDAFLHGGRQPWEWLQPLFGYPLATLTINFVYNIWFVVLFAMLFWQTFSARNPRLRMQYFLTYALSWVLLGTVGAVALSSAGPCFYGRLVSGADPFRPLMDYLRSAQESVPVWALGVQEELWQSYQRGETGQIRGISAMPSMHISMVFLFALTGWRTNRWLGIALSLFAVVVMIGCIHLGWHYAIDGYVAAAGTWLIWWAVGRLQSAWERKHA